MGIFPTTVLMFASQIVPVVHSASYGRAFVSYEQRQVNCAKVCGLVCTITNSACYCGMALQQTILACASCRLEDNETQASVQAYLDSYIQECKDAGIAVGPLVIPGATASLTPTPTPTSTSTSSVSSTSSSTLTSPSSSASPAPASSQDMGPVIGIIVGAIVTGLAAAVLIWYFCVRRKRVRIINLRRGEAPYEGKALTEASLAATPYAPAHELKSTSSRSPTRSYRPSTTVTSSIYGDEHDRIPLLNMSNAGHRHDGFDSAPGSVRNSLLSPPGGTDTQSWVAATRRSQLSDDGRPTLSRAATSSVVSSTVPSTVSSNSNRPVSGSDLDRIAARVATMLSATVSSPISDDIAPPMYDEVARR